MNSRERVIRAIEHRQVDRVPFDFWAEPPTLERLYTHCGTRNLDAILDGFNVDLRHLQAVAPPDRDCGAYYQNFWGERYIYRDTKWGPMRTDIPGALAGATSIEDLQTFPWPEPGTFDYSQLASACDRYNDYALLYGFADIWQRPCLVRGMENALVDLHLRPDWMHFLCQTFTDFYVEDYVRAFHHSGGRIDIFLVISDLGSQNSPLISLSMFEEFVVPYLKALVDCIHGLGAYVMFHSCGYILPFVERLIEIGVDVLDPIQPVSASMSPERLKEQFSGRVCFHGGIDIQDLLPNGTRDQVKSGISRYLDVFGQDGGYICAPAHLFQPDIPPQNIQAFYEMTGYVPQ
jgi:uroporphyrinogen decarboxylase